jgi:hypothetical protein
MDAEHVGSFGRADVHNVTAGPQSEAEIARAGSMTSGLYPAGAPREQRLHARRERGVRIVRIYGRRRTSE